MSVKQFQLDCESLVIEVDQSVGMHPTGSVDQQLPPHRIPLFLRVVQRPVVHPADERRFLIEWTRYGQVVKDDASVQVVVLVTPAPVNIGESVDSPEISCRHGDDASEITSRCHPIIYCAMVISYWICKEDINYS